MKELSIEEKAQAYDEALKWMENVYPTLSHEQQMEAEVFFPIFKESEDERIRKALIDGFTVMKESKNCGKTFSNHNIPVVDILAWLEKQDSHYTFEIKKGYWYKCVCDYMLNGSDLIFKNDRLYYCRSDWRLRGEIDEQNVKDIGVNGYKSFFRPATNQEIKDWLEKQGEDPTTLPKWKYKKDNAPLLRDSLILNKYGCVAKSPSGAIVSDVWVINYDELAKLPKEEFENQGKQETKEEHYPQRFMVGDIIKYNGTEYKITSIGSNGYKVYPLTYDEDAASLISFRAPATLVEQKQEAIAVENCLEQSENNPTEKVEPKFHEGDWVVQGYNILKIKWVGDTRYCFETVGGYIDDMLVSEIDSQFHLWTVQDAKPGNVLVDVYGNIGIFEKRYGINWHTYCYLENKGRFISEGGSHGSICYPATKEQRDQLEKAMTDAGYTFDFEKKKLKKVEKSTWSEEDEKMLKLVIGSCEQCGNEYAYYWLKSLKDRVQPQPNPGWSKEDDYNLQCMIAKVTSDIQKGNVGRNNELIDWLKSLSYKTGSRKHWKPRESEIRILEDIFNGNINPCNYQATLHNILEQLKVLRDHE